VQALADSRTKPAAFQASYLLYLHGCRLDLEREEGEEKQRAWRVMEQLIESHMAASPGGRGVMGGSSAADPLPELQSMLQRLGSAEGVRLVSQALIGCPPCKAVPSVHILAGVIFVGVQHLRPPGCLLHRVSSAVLMASHRRGTTGCRWRMVPIIQLVVTACEACSESGPGALQESTEPFVAASRLVRDLPAAMAAAEQVVDLGMVRQVALQVLEQLEPIQVKARLGS
jgi:hypothetical protein